jgi:hypothetical protein
MLFHIYTNVIISTFIAKLNLSLIAKRQYYTATDHEENKFIVQIATKYVFYCTKDNLRNQEQYGY